MSGDQLNERNIVTIHEVDVTTDGVKLNDEDGDVKSGDRQPQQPGDVDDGDETRCGIGPWRPRCLQPMANMWCFTAGMSLILVLNGANFAYYVSVITQIERRFGLSSRTTGFIKNIDNIGFMLTVLAVSHLGRYGNKPRIIVISGFLSGLAIFLFAIPHFIYGGPGASLQVSSTR